MKHTVALIVLFVSFLAVALWSLVPIAETVTASSHPRAQVHANVTSVTTASKKTAYSFGSDTLTLSSTARLTIVAPHPDDETLALGGLIFQARSRHIPVSIIFMTNGDNNKTAARREGFTLSPSDMIKLGTSRQNEAIDAMANLGVPRESVYFLSLPDGGLKSILTPEYATTAFVSQSTGLSNNSAYPNSFVQNMPYTGTAAYDALIAAVNSTHPTNVFVTMRDDQHPDHWAAGQFMEDIKAKITGRPSRYFYLVHYPSFPNQTEDNYNTPLVPPAVLKNKRWLTIPLTKAAEAQQSKALHSYNSQMDQGTPNSLFSGFIRPNELVSR